MALNSHLARETIWFEKYKFDDAERLYHEKSVPAEISKGTSPPKRDHCHSQKSLVDEIARARNQIKSSLHCPPTASKSSKRNRNKSSASSTSSQTGLEARIEKLELDNQQMNTVIKNLENYIVSLETKLNATLATLASTKGTVIENNKTPQKTEENGAADEDDIDLFGSEDEEDDLEKERLKEERLKAYAEKKAKKPGPIAKSNVILDVKPWDDETDMKEMERRVREIICDGLLWGAARLVPLAYGINKLQISSVVEDEKVSIDWLTETIQEIEDLVQSVDIAAFNKI